MGKSNNKQLTRRNMLKLLGASGLRLGIVGTSLEGLSSIRNNVASTLAESEINARKVQESDTLEVRLFAPEMYYLSREIVEHPKYHLAKLMGSYFIGDFLGSELTHGWSIDDKRVVGMIPSVACCLWIGQKQKSIGEMLSDPKFKEYGLDLYFAPSILARPGEGRRDYLISIAEIGLPIILSGAKFPELGMGYTAMSPYLRQSVQRKADQMKIAFGIGTYIERMIEEKAGKREIISYLRSIDRSNRAL